MNNYEPTEKELQAQGWIKLPEEPEILFSDPNWNKIGVAINGEIWIFSGRDEDDILEQDENEQWWIAPPRETMSEREFAYKWERYCDPWRIYYGLWRLISETHEQAAEEKGAKHPVAVMVQGYYEYRIETYDIADAERIYSFADANMEEYAYRLPDGTVVAWTEKGDEGWVRYAWTEKEIQERLADELSEADEDEDEDEEDEDE